MEGRQYITDGVSMNFKHSPWAAVGGALVMSYGVTVALLLALAFLLYKMKVQPAQVVWAWPPFTYSLRWQGGL